MTSLRPLPGGFTCKADELAGSTAQQRGRQRGTADYSARMRAQPYPTGKGHAGKGPSPFVRCICFDAPCSGALSSRGAASTSLKTPWRQASMATVAFRKTGQDRSLEPPIRRASRNRHSPPSKPPGKTLRPPPKRRRPADVRKMSEIGVENRAIDGAQRRQHGHQHRVQPDCFNHHFAALESFCFYPLLKQDDRNRHADSFLPGALRLAAESSPCSHMKNVLRLPNRSTSKGHRIHSRRFIVRRIQLQSMRSGRDVRPSCK